MSTEDLREKILRQEYEKMSKGTSYERSAIGMLQKDCVYNAMDEYMKESVLDAFSFLAKHNVECEVDTEGKEVFYYKGELISKEELFQNFL